MVELGIKLERVWSFNWIGVLKYLFVLQKAIGCNSFRRFIAFIHFNHTHYLLLSADCWSFIQFTFVLHSRWCQSVCLLNYIHTTVVFVYTRKVARQTIQAKQDGVWKIIKWHLLSDAGDAGVDGADWDLSSSSIWSGQCGWILRGLGGPGPAVWHFFSDAKCQIPLYGADSGKLIRLK